MITIPRSLVRQVRAVFRRALHPSGRTPAPAVQLSADAAGLTIRAVGHETAAEYRLPGSFAAAEIRLPFDFLEDCEGRGDEPLAIEAAGKDKVQVQWRDRIPQLMVYSSPSVKEVGVCPAVPAEMSAPDPRLLGALRDAMPLTDPNSSRYALGNLELCGASGQIVATDGRNILFQDGFQFPWQDKVLLPRTTFFGCKDWPQENPIRIGVTERYVVIQNGPWTVHFRRDGGRFPKLDDVIPVYDAAKSRLHLADADAEFLLLTLSELPSDDENYQPITLELDRGVAVRARAENREQPTEIFLTNSSCSGEPMRLCMDRRFLERAIRLGLRELCFYDPEQAALSRDAYRHYVWMMLSAASAIAPRDDAIRMETTLSGATTGQAQSRSAAPSTNHHSTRTKTKMPRNRISNSQPATNGAPEVGSNGNGQAETNGHAAGNGNGHHAAETTADAPVGSPIEQALVLRSAVRGALAATNDLIASLRRQRKQSKAVQDTLASLRQIQALAG